jgi:hypothetical protein
MKLKSFAYFCKANPGIRFGGFINYSKYEILQQIPDEFKPETYFIKNKNYRKKVLPFGEDLGGAFPFIVKPDVGERGKKVELIKNENDWENYPFSENLIIQEFIDFPLEFGIFYARFPSEKSGKILSVTGKEFLVFESDGKTTLREFIENHFRAKNRTGYLKNKFKNQLDEIFPKGEKILLEPIGNHNRGTKFLDNSNLISEKLTLKIDELAKKIEGFYYGRFDVKANSVGNLKNGEFKILEINGVNSEPTHIYDPDFSLAKAYKEVKRHFDVQYEIVKQNRKTKVPSGFYISVLKRIFN